MAIMATAPVTVAIPLATKAMAARRINKR
jgi:hypothetical protein